MTTTYEIIERHNDESGTVTVRRRADGYRALVTCGGGDRDILAYAAILDDSDWIPTPDDDGDECA